MEKSTRLTTSRLSLFNLKSRSFRTLSLISVVAVLAFVLFGGAYLSLSMKNGLNSVKARFGADLMAVPVGYDEDAEGILLKGEPSYFYFDKAYESKISAVEGVESVSAQFFLTSTNQDCCDVPVQFIGFDPETDFSVQPWIAETYSGNVSDGDLIIGNDIEVENGETLKFFNKEYTVAAKLEKTGTGLDCAVYANMNTLMDLFDSAKKTGLTFTNDINPEESISTVLIKISDGYDLDEVTHNIRSNMDGTQIIKTKSMMTDIAGSLDNLITFIYVFAAILIFAVLITFTTVFSVTVNERRKEFAVFRILGATRKKLSAIVLGESLIIGAAGGITGTALAALIVLSFNVYIGDKLNLPYLQPSVPTVALLAAITVIISLAIGSLSAMYSAIKISRYETYRILREGEQ